MLEETAELSRQNNHLLRSLRSDARWRKLGSTLKWVFIIGSIVASYYYVQPWIDQLKATYQSVSGSNLPSFDWQKLIKPR